MSCGRQPRANTHVKCRREVRNDLISQGLALGCIPKRRKAAGTNVAEPKLVTLHVRQTKTMVCAEKQEAQDG